jgi:hypothetical protein
MTLSTDIYILDPVDPMEVFNFVNEHLLKVKDPEFEHELDTNWDREAKDWLPNTEGIMTLSNKVGQGFDAWFMSKYREGGPLYTEDQYDDDEDYEEPYLLAPACFMKLDFDTAYGYKVPGIGGCADLHARYIIALHDWLSTKGVRIKWRNEFTGDIFNGLDGLEEFSKAGADARDWFKSILPGVLAHTLSEVEKEES